MAMGLRGLGHCFDGRDNLIAASFSGGVMVEVYNDVAVRSCPITRREAQAMIAAVKGAGCSTAFADGRRVWCVCPWAHSLFASGRSG